MNNEPLFIEPVVFVRPDGSPVQPVGGGLSSFFKKAGSVIKKIAKPVLGVVANVALPGVGGLLVNTAMTATDVMKAKKQREKVISAAKKADAKAIKQVTDAFNKLKAESDDFRAKRGLPPLNVTLPDLKKSKPEEVEKVFTILQDDAAAITARETNAPVTSMAGDTVTPTGQKKNNTMLIVGGVAVVGLAAFMLLRKRR